MPSRPLWPLLTVVTIAALLISWLRFSGEALWPTEIMSFAMRWVFIAAFAMFGRAIFSRRSL